MEINGKKVEEHNATININNYLKSTEIIFNPNDFILDINQKQGQIIFWKRKIPNKI